MADWIIRQGDSKPSLKAVLTEGGIPMNLDGCSVKWRMRLIGSNNEPIVEDCLIVDSSAGSIEYTPSTLATSVPGNYQGVFKVTFPDSTHATFPTNGYAVVQVTPLDF